MSASKSDKLIFAETPFAGEISANGETAPITFRVSAGADCRLVFDVDPVNAQTYMLAVRGQGVSGTSIQKLGLTGNSADGKSTIAAQNVYVGPHGFNDGGSWISLNSRALKITRALDHPVDKPFLRLWFRSFRAFRNPVIETPLGRLSVQGAASDVSSDDMSGSATLEALSSDPGADWFSNADDFLRHMHRGLALAHGGRLQTPRLDYAHGRTCDITFFAGTGFTAELPVQHYLNQGPFIEALAKRYELAGPLPDVLWTALGWMQTDTTFDETRFLTAMTALEAIIESELPARRGTIIPKATFKSLRRKLETLLASDDSLPAEARDIFLNKIAALNRKVFTQKIDALFDHYKLPRDDFEGNVIRCVVSLRNDIVHTGNVPNGADIWPSIILVRELITRILLREIGFVGRYCCYIGGLTDREFPAPT